MLAPLLFSTYTVDQLLTQVLIFGIVAMSLVFLASYGGMVSLAQTALFGIAGFVFGNMTTVDTKGLTLGYSPWVGILPAILIATAIGLVYGGLAARSTGIYFLMITLTYGVIANLSFGQIEKHLRLRRHQRHRAAVDHRHDRSAPAPPLLPRRS